MVQSQVMGIPVKSVTCMVTKSPVAYLSAPDCNLCPINGSSPALKQMRLGPKITETVKGKLSLGAKILQVGGVERIFKQLFNVSEDEKLLKASQCYLSTTAGPLAGLLFISTDRVAFCSERSIKLFPSPNGKPIRIHYKVMIPVKKIEQIHQSENVKKPTQKYIEDQVIGIPIKLASAAVGRESQRNRARGSLISYPDPANHHKHLFSSPSSGCFTFQQIRLGARFTETVKGKFSLGAKILQVGGVEKVFRKLFNVLEDEKLLKASQCYLSTTAGPIAGLLFISTNKLAFCSERSIKITSQAGDLARVYYKEQVIGIPAGSAAAYPVERRPRLLLEYPSSQQYMPTPANKSLTVNRMRLGTKITETLKGKLSLGARILQVGGVKKVFRQLFSVSEGERLLKACQCYLSTTAGPIAGLLFISTDKIAFCSERSIKLSSPEGKLVRVHYKVIIPLRKIKAANQSENVKNPSQKYIELVTVDGFDFWFMGFLNYQKAFKYLQQAISEAASDEH
ncbi:hypothetical protein Tsubulata_012235 [Turnera subulata]|uniref:GRAM domain-containing protein n=1 Tax=Turnera subulata TaxID=218843 RepID=A0A9Q0FIX7_9ROSI|nr:hypothetical protein Tsubulata_012235 [Turnera subulata]